jgi:hypothetical protein
MVAFTGEIAIETSAAPVTVSVVEPETEPSVAVMVADPVPALVASPMLPAVLLITAVALDEDVQLTIDVMSLLVPSV